MIGNVAKTENGVYKFYYTKPTNCRVSEFEIENSIQEIETLHTANEDYIKAISSEEGKVKLTERATDKEYYAHYNIEYPYSKKKFNEAEKYFYETRKQIEKRYTRIIFCLIGALITSFFL
jgi:hypothetical protein